MRKYEAHLQNIAHISSCKRILFVFFVAGEPLLTCNPWQQTINVVYIYHQ